MQGVLIIEGDGLRPGGSVRHGRDMVAQGHDRGHKIGGAIDQTHRADDPPRGQHMGHPVLIHHMDVNRGVDVARV